MFKFCILQLVYVALFLAPLVVAWKLNILPLQRWYGDLLGQLWSNNNRRAGLLLFLAVIWTAQAIVVASIYGLPESAFISGNREIAQGVSHWWEKKTDGQMLKRLGLADLVADIPSSVKVVEEPAKSRSSRVWFNMAVIGWFIAIIYLPLAFRDEAVIVAIWLLSAFKRRKAASGASTAGVAQVTGATAVARELGKMKWWSPSWWFQYLLDDVLSDVGVDWLKGRLKKVVR